MVEVTPAEPGTSYTVCLNRDRQRAETLRLNRDREGAEVSGDPGLLRCAMKVLSIAVFLVSCVPLLDAQQTAAPVGQPQPTVADPASQPPKPEIRPEDRCSIEGRVLSAATGEPLRKAQIQAALMNSRNNASSYATISDAEGHFSITKLEPGQYHISVSRNGYTNTSYGQRKANGPSTPLSLSTGQNVRDVVFRLTPNAVISGRVFDEDGEPMERVNVQVRLYRYFRGERQLMPAGGAMTDDLGEYRIFGLAAGRYFLSATYRSGWFNPAQDRSAPKPEEEGYAPTYYPGTTDSAGAAPIEAAAGTQLRGIDFTLKKTRVVRVRGRVVNTITNRVARNTMVVLRSRGLMGGFGGERGTRLDNRGEFDIRGVAPGAYIITAMWRDGESNYDAHQALDIGSTDVENVSLIITPGVRVNGRVRFEAGTDANPTQVHIALLSRSVITGNMGKGTQIKEDGSFTFENVSPDTYNVNVFAPPGFYVKSIRMGGQDALESGLDLSAGAADAIDVLLSPNGGEVEGAVTNSKQQPASGTAVVLIPDSHRDQRQFYKNSATDQNGHFSIKGIAPGNYKLFAWEDIDPGAAEDPEFLKPYENKGQAFSIEEKSRHNAQLELIPAEDTADHKRAGNQ